MSHRIYFYCFTKDCSYYTKRIFEALQRFSDELNLKFQKESIPKKVSFSNQRAYRRIQ